MRPRDRVYLRAESYEHQKTWHSFFAEEFVQGELVDTRRPRITQRSRWGTDRFRDPIRFAIRTAAITFRRHGCLCMLLF